MKELPLSSDSPFLESYMVRITTRGRVIYWIIIAIVICVLGMLPFVYTDISVVAPGFFQSELEKQKIFIPYQGRIIRTSVRNGSRVEKGDTLYIIESESVRARQIACEKKIEDNNAAIADLQKLTSITSPDSLLPKDDFQTEKYYLDYSNMLKARSIQAQSYGKLKAEFDRNSVLYSNQLIPASEFENSRFLLKAEEENLNKVFVSHLGEWHSELIQRLTNKKVLEVELNECLSDLNNRIVRAPVGGEIIQSADIQEGMVASYNQQVAEISPDGQLLATCYISPSDVGLIKSGQKVKIQVHALNYNEWGLLNAEIIEISDDMVIDNGTVAHFRARCIPERTSLKLRNGYEAELKKGMTFNARIILTRRSLFNLLFDKIDRWVNPNLNKKDISSI